MFLKCSIATMLFIILLVCFCQAKRLLCISERQGRSFASLAVISYASDGNVMAERRKKAFFDVKKAK